MRCEQCGSEKIIYYRQVRVDRVNVVVARCENGHKPEKRRPFYPVSQFNVMSLPLLNENKDIDQPMLFDEPKQESTGETLLEWFEKKKQIKNAFPPMRKS